MVDIVCYWSTDCRSWIVICLDIEGNQIWEAEYQPNRRTLKASWMPPRRTRTVRSEP